jgi:cytochrome P450
MPSAAPDLTAALPPGPRLQRRAERRWLTDFGSLMLECRKRYGDAFTLPVPGVYGSRATRAVVAGNPLEVYDLLRAGADENTAGNCRERVLRFTGPESILIIEGEAHLQRRRLILPHFHRRAAERLDGLIASIADAEIDAWPLDTPFSLAKGLSAITFSVLVRVTFGDVDADWRARLGQGVRGTAQPWVGPRVVDAADRAARRKLDDLVFERIALHRAGELENEGDDFLSVFAAATDEEGRTLTDDQVHDELLTLLLAGHDSVAIALTWALEHILRDAELAAALREEAVAGQQRLMDAVVQEVLRLHPPLPLVARKLTAPHTVDGHDLAVGTVVIPCIWLAHRNAEAYDEPLSFRWDRFLERAPDPRAWVPFGAGGRRCLGSAYADVQLRVVLQRILQRTMLHILGSAPGHGQWRMVGLWPGSARTIMRERRPLAEPA